MPTTGYVTAKPIAKFFSVAQPTIYRWAENKKIPSLRFEGTVRFDFNAVRLAIEEGEWSSTGYVTAKPIAKFFLVTQPTIYRWAEKNKIPCIRFEGTVRFDFNAVRLAIEEGKWPFSHDE